MKKTLRVICAVILLLAGIFAAGRYGWKLRGFDACSGGEITSVSAEEGSVRIEGRWPGISGKGFIGYVSEEKDGRLYVGFRFSSLFGIFEKGTFDITIPTDTVISEVIQRSGSNETVIWRRN